MGICSSCHTSKSTTTAKLIQIDGNLQEYPYPVKVSYVLQNNPSSFICDSDDMDFDNIVEPISDDDELVPGQLYFALPLTRLKRPIRREEMAALAVKASNALSKGGGDKCGCGGKSFTPVVEKPGKRQVAEGDVGRKRSRGGGRRRSGAGGLSAIPE